MKFLIKRIGNKIANGLRTVTFNKLPSKVEDDDFDDKEDIETEE
jgi:hypothetical protein